MRDQNGFFNTFFSNPINCAATAVVLGLACYALYHYNESRKRAIAAQAAQPSASANDASSQQPTNTRSATHASSQTVFQMPAQTNTQPDARALSPNSEKIEKGPNGTFFPRQNTVTSIASDLCGFDKCEIENK